MDHSKKKQPPSIESLSFPVESADPTQTEQLPEIRRIWDAEEQTWYYSVVDFIKLLTDAPIPVTYWTTFKKRRKVDPFLQDIFGQLKMQPMRAKDGKLRETECATRPVMLRLVQSIPSKRAETVRLWLAQIGEEKLQEAEQQTQVDQLRTYYLSRGRTPEWADARIRNLIGRNLLTDEWVLRGAQQHLHFGLLTATIHKGTFGITPHDHHHTVKKLPKGTKNPRDHYTDIELNVLALSETAARTLHARNDSQGVPQLLQDAQAAGAFGGQVRQQFEELTGEPVVSSQNFLDQSKGKQKKKQLPTAEQDTLFDQEEQEQSPEE
ncbi:MAG: BRO-N domain-containing protein [Ktedonobacteraceae bacterium]